MNKLTYFLRLKALSFIVFSGALLMFVSCTKNSQNSSTTPAAAVMAFNLAPDKSNVAFSVSGTRLGNAVLNYAQFSGQYLGASPGDRIVQAFDNNSISTIFASTGFSFEIDKFYSVFFVGKGDHYRNVVVNDDITSLSGSTGSAYIRYVQAIPDSTSAFNVVVSNTGGNVVSDIVSFPMVSTFKSVTPGEITITVTNGSDINLTKSITVESKKVYTILLAGVSNSSTTPLQISAVTNGTLN